MFAKPCRTKSNVAIKGSDRKRLRSDLERLFGGSLTKEQTLEIVPNKEEMSVMKLYSYKGENVAVYCVKKHPVLFEHEKVLFPTIYTVWKYPAMLHTFTTHTPVFEKLHNGADLMLPGVVVSKNGLPDVQRDQVVAINVTDNQAALAVGSALMSSREMVEVAGMRGKGIRVVHTFGDYLWMLGDKQEPPSIPVPLDHYPNELSFEESEEPVDVVNNDESSNCATSEDKKSRENESKQEGCSSNPDVSQLSLLDVDIVTDGKMEDSRTDVEIMEQLLNQCFLTALKKKIKDSELPILTSTFYRTHVLACCPSNRNLDIKRTSFKKLGKYLKQMESDGLIQTKEVTKGNDYIIGICRLHPTLKSFTDFAIDTEVESTESTPNTVSSYGIVTQKQYEPPEISVVHCVSAVTLPLFSEFGYRKGDPLALNEIRTQVTNYVKNHELLVADQPRMVILDPLLHRAMYDKGSNNILQASWEDVFKKVISKMQACHQLKFKGMTPIIRSGGPPSIHINVQQRAGNKKVTIVHNLESFLITPSQFADSMRKKAQASTSISDLVGAANKNLQQVLIQGNQVSLVEALLTGPEYKIPLSLIHI